MKLSISTCVILGLAACTTGHSAPDGGDDAGPAPDPDGPAIVSFVANTDTLVETSDVLTVSAVLTDPDGVDDIIGGQLFDADAGTAYGAFATSAQEGAYAITLTWGQLVQARHDLPGPWARPVPLHLRGSFFDQAAHEASRDLAIDLACEVPAGRLSRVQADGCKAGAACGSDLPWQIEDRTVDCYLAPEGPSCSEACALTTGTACARSVERDQGTEIACDVVIEHHLGAICYCQ